MKIPYTQQFAPNVTPLRPLINIIRQKQGKQDQLTDAIASAFFKESQSPVKMAKNTLIALKYHEILGDDFKPTPFGMQLLDAPDEVKAAEILATNILLKHDGIMLIETLKEMKTGSEEITLVTLAKELTMRGFELNKNSSDLSGVLGWLRTVGVIANQYDVDDGRYAALVGTTPQIIDAMKELTAGQIAFLKAMVALGVEDWTAHNTIAKHAETLFSGEIHYNWKALDNTILKPLVEAGLIEHRKAQKSTETARGGRPAEVKPTEKFEKEVAKPSLEPLYKAAGFRDVRKIRSIPLAQLVADIRQKKDDDLRGKSLEMLAIRFCQLLSLEFMGWRETDEELVGGGEVDGFLHSARLIYSRWQIQCKASDKITYETLAKEVGVAEITLANVILIVGTGTVTDGASTFRRRLVNKSSLNIVVIDGKMLDAIVKDPSTIGGIMVAQARDAMNSKPQPNDLIKKPEGSPDDDPDGGGKSSSASDMLKAFVKNVTGEPELPLFKPAYTTPNGSMYHGDAYDVLRFLIAKGVRVKLLFTSPPFALLRKKAYGNEDQEQYVDWFMRFAPLFRQILEPNGSFVMDIGGAWLPGIPARSVYQYELLLRLCKSGFYLAQEFYHYNPAKLPTPAEWVTVRRIRVKDAMNNVWWFTQEPFVDSDNKRVLREYSESMKLLLKNGYKAKLRPSGHDISTKFNVDRGGAIPSNLLELANTDSNGHYLQECKRNNMKPHPARFPVGLPDFFIRFLTNPGDLVYDPFAGSNVTGEAAEALGRRWLASEISDEYVKGSQFRFTERPAKKVEAARPSLFAIS